MAPRRGRARLASAPAADSLRGFCNASRRPRMLRPPEDVDAVRMHRSSHEARRGVQKLRQLEHVAEEGESAETPLILIGEVWFVVAIALLVMVALALLAYRLAA
jgi:hypothetical protein